MEHEAERLARLVQRLGTARVHERSSWSLNLSEAERQHAFSKAADLRPSRYIVVAQAQLAQQLIGAARIGKVYLA